MTGLIALLPFRTPFQSQHVDVLPEGPGMMAPSPRLLMIQGDVTGADDAGDIPDGGGAEVIEAGLGDAPDRGPASRGGQDRSPGIRRSAPRPHA
jgi:hypothetical protein